MYFILGILFIAVSTFIIVKLANIKVDDDRDENSYY